MLPTTNGLVAVSEATRSIVCWNMLCGPVRRRNCLGRAVWDAGHKRVPTPPHITTGWMCLAVKIAYPARFADRLFAKLWGACKHLASNNMKMLKINDLQAGAGLTAAALFCACTRFCPHAPKYSC